MVRDGASAAALADDVAALKQRVLKLAQALSVEVDNAHAERLPARDTAVEIERILSDASQIAIAAGVLLALDTNPSPKSIADLEVLVARAENAKNSADTEALLKRLLGLKTVDDTDARLLEPVHTRAAQLADEMREGRAPGPEKLVPFALLLRGIDRDGDDRQDVAFDVAEVWGKELGRALSKGKILGDAIDRAAEIMSEASPLAATADKHRESPTLGHPHPPEQKDDANQILKRRPRASDSLERGNRAQETVPKRERLTGWGRLLLGSEVQPKIARPSTPILPRPKPTTDLVVPPSAEVHVTVANSPPESNTDLDSAPLWRLLRDGDEAGAYWYARCAESLGTRPPISSQLLSLLQASRWLDRNANALVGDMAYVAERLDESGEPYAAMIATAAALVPTLTHPVTQLRGRLHRGLDSTLDPVVQAVEAFANFNQALTPDLLTDSVLHTDHSRDVDDARMRVEKWLVDGPRRTINFQAATRVWKELFRIEFAPVLRRIIDRDPAVLRDATALTSRLRSSKYVNMRIEELDAQLRGTTTARIVGSALIRLEREISETADLLDAWVEVAEKMERLRNLSWLTERAQELRRKLQDTLPAADAWLRDLRISADLPQVAAAAVLRRSLAHLAHLLRLSEDREHQEVPHGIETLIQGVEGIVPSLDVRLLWTTTPASSAGSPTDEEAEKLARDLTQPIPSVLQAFDRWLQLARFDEAFRLEPLLIPTDVARAKSALDAECVKLDRRVADLRSAIELGVIDGYVGDERAEFLGDLGAILPRETRNIAGALQICARVQARVDGLRDARIAEAWSAWVDMQSDLTNRIASTDLHRWQELIEAARARGDVRVLDERLAELRDRLGKGQDLSIEPERTTSSSRTLRQFQDMVGQLDHDRERSSWGEIRERMKRGAAFAPGLEMLSPELSRQRASVADRWFHLVQKGVRQSDVELVKGASVVLREIGFEPLGTEPFKVVQRHGTAVMMTAALSDGGRSPIPDFGSLAQNQYGIAFVWDIKNVEAIGRLIQSSNELPPAILLLYAGRLSIPNRSQLRQVSRNSNIKMLCLDELLLLFLLAQPETSLERFFACTLPYVSLNPYTPFQAGEVAPEMYYGRKLLVDQLLSPGGSCIVYGGRQLGKSALLREVRRRFHQPEKQQFAIVLDILTVGDPKAGVETSRLWQQLRDRLRDPKIGIRFETKRSNADELASALREHLEKHPQMRLTVLLDEADNFLDADAKDGFKVVNMFRTLMGETQRRFRVVFTGLHNVQRFQQLPNQPLAHFGAAIQVGPLEPRDAEALVRRPLEALGFEFAEQDDVLRILSYTNYHPGLIQLFCHNLLQELQQTSQHAPVKFTRQRIDKVYESPTVRNEIVKRFEWTLALDQRYQAVAWSLIVDQGSDRRSNPPKMTSELFALVKEWWPRGFVTTEFEEFRGLLDEMVGLGVLTASTTGFRLRSPNVIQLMGDVDLRLQELMDREPPAVFDVDRLHRPAQDDLYSPLTLGQERQLLARRWGVGLLFTSSALDSDGLLPSIRALRDEGRLALVDAPSNLEPNGFAEWVTGEANKTSASMFITVIPTANDPVHTATLVDAACATCARRAAGQKVVGRLVFVFDPSATSAWLDCPAARVTEQQVDVVLWPHKWSPQGLRARLQQRELPDDEASVQMLQSITGGWDMLVSRAFRAEMGGKGKRDQHSNRLQELARCLDIAGDPNRESFLRGLGIRDDARVMLLLQLVLGLVGGDWTPSNQLTADVFASEMPGLSSEELGVLFQLLTRLGIMESQSDHDGNDEVRIDGVVARLMSKA